MYRYTQKSEVGLHYADVTMYLKMYTEIYIAVQCWTAGGFISIVIQ